MKPSSQFTFLFLCFALFAGAQNHVHITSSDGTRFKVESADSSQPRSFQSQVRIENIVRDTMQLNISTEDNKKLNARLFLLDKRKHTRFKDFEYLLDMSSGQPELKFLTMRDARTTALKVPDEPVVDTSAKMNNAVLGTFCELKQGKVLYFNNLPEQEKCKVPMPDENFSYINILMKKADVPDKKYSVIDNVILNNCLNTAQLVRLTGYIDYELDKLRLVKAGYGRLTDPENRNELAEAFRFESSRNELNRFYKNEGREMQAGSRICEQAATEAEISKFEADLKMHNNDGQRMEYLKKNYRSNCYSVKQVKSILMAFIHDREKLEAAKLLYHFCTDKDQFPSVSEVFSYNLSGPDLEDFLKRQKK